MRPEWVARAGARAEARLGVAARAEAAAGVELAAAAADERAGAAAVLAVMGRVAGVQAAARAAGAPSKAGRRWEASSTSCSSQRLVRHRRRKL